MGLDVLIDYLSFRLGMMRHEQRIAESRTASEERLNPSLNNTTNTITIDNKVNGYIRPSVIDMSGDNSPSIKRRTKHVAKLNMGESKDDIHVCIMCMRAIMNNKVYFKVYFNMYLYLFFLSLFFLVRFQHGYSTQGSDKLHIAQFNTQELTY